MFSSQIKGTKSRHACVVRLDLGHCVLILESNFFSGISSKNFILSVLEEEYSENHFAVIKSFIPSHNQYVLSDLGRTTILFGFQKTQEEPDSSLQAWKEL